mmetsp:Transcript_20214/g.47858  ORF Transcript_20214/g.47858 Transcript_20214/m.47858 type:complete len:201 (-) Transcript_20214:820-1422(-)
MHGVDLSQECISQYPERDAPRRGRQARHANGHLLRDPDLLEHVSSIQHDALVAENDGQGFGSLCNVTTANQVSIGHPAVLEEVTAEHRHRHRLEVPCRDGDERGAGVQRRKDGLIHVSGGGDLDHRPEDHQHAKQEAAGPHHDAQPAAIAMATSDPLSLKDDLLLQAASAQSYAKDHHRQLEQAVEEQQLPRVPLVRRPA